MGGHRATGDFNTELNRHFVLGAPMDALQFPQIWLPSNCSTHRFTNASINAFVSHILKLKGTPKGRLDIFMLGDSAMRGLFCGISRILAGSEVVGPCSNAVCGTSPHNLVQANLMNKLIPIDFGPNLRITFAFLISLRVQHTDWIIEAAIKAKPYAVVFNTGAWDFDIISRLHMKEISSDYCTNETESISLKRATTPVKAVMRELGRYARQLGVRAIYRNSHFNARYGALRG